MVNATPLSPEGVPRQAFPFTAEQMPSPDSNLVRKIRQGDTAAWNELLLQFEGRLMAFARQKIKDHATCQDLVQEAFLGFFSSLDRFDEKKNIQNYLFTICSNKIIDHLRKQGRRPLQDLGSPSSGPDLLELRADSALGLTTWFHLAEKRQWENQALAATLRDYLSSLAAEGDYLKVKALELVWVLGLSNLEAAGILNISNQQAANIRFQGVKALREFLAARHLPPELFPELQDEEGGEA